MVVQRVSRAEVRVGRDVVGRIGTGLLVLLGVHREDGAEDAAWLAERLVKLRIFDDAEGRMNLALGEAGGEILVVSQFTLYGTTRKGNRPSYNRSADPETAVPLYEEFCRRVGELAGVRVETGSFGASMEVDLCNDGPVTLVLDSRERDF